MGYLNTAKDKFIKFFNLSFKDKQKIVIYFVLFHIFLVAFRIFDYRKSKNVIDRLINPIRKTKYTYGRFVKYESKIINYSTRNCLLKSTCLEKSLFLYFILGLYGINCDLKIGIQGSTHNFSAHAWLEHGSIIINDNPKSIENYLPFNAKL